MFAGLSDPAGYRFLTDAPPADKTVLRDRYRRQIAGDQQNGGAVWLNWIVRLHPAGPAIGFTQATIDAGSALIGYQLFPACWGRGFGTRAVRLTIRTVFARSDVVEARALVDTGNLASASLLRRLGFVLERTILDADHIRGARSDEHEFVLLRR